MLSKWYIKFLPVAASSAITFHLMKTHCKITYAPRGDRKILTSRSLICPAMYTKVPTRFYVPVAWQLLDVTFWEAFRFHLSQPLCEGEKRFVVLRLGHIRPSQLGVESRVAQHRQHVQQEAGRISLTLTIEKNDRKAGIPGV